MNYFEDEKYPVNDKPYEVTYKSKFFKKHITKEELKEQMDELIQEQQEDM